MKGAPTRGLGDSSAASQALRGVFAYIRPARLRIAVRSRRQAGIRYPQGALAAARSSAVGRGPLPSSDTTHSCPTRSSATSSRAHHRGTGANAQGQLPPPDSGPVRSASPPAAPGSDRPRRRGLRLSAGRRSTTDWQCSVSCSCRFHLALGENVVISQRPPGMVRRSSRLLNSARASSQPQAANPTPRKLRPAKFVASLVQRSRPAGTNRAAPRFLLQHREGIPPAMALGNSGCWRRTA